MAIATDWSARIGYQRDWIWRGWQIRYSFRPADAGKSRKSPLLLIHGFGAAIEHWRHNIPVLCHDRNVYALDLLGFGGSRKAATVFSIALWGEQIHDFWQAIIGEPVILVGNSIGSVIALQAAATYPGLAAGLVMINLPDIALRKAIIPRPLQAPVRAIENLFSTPLLLKPLFWLLRRRWTLQRWARIAYSDRRAISEELIEILAAPAQDEGATRTFCYLCQSVNEAEFAPSAQALLARLNLPILLLWGEQDRMVPASLAPVFAGLNARLQLILLPEGGHCPHDEMPDRVNQLLLDWLASEFRPIAPEEKYKLI